MRAVLAALALAWGATTVSAEMPKRTAPDFSLPALNGERTVTLSDYRGRYVLVDFWASWCPPCRESLRYYQGLRKRLAARFGNNVFEVIAINVDITADEGKQFLESKQIDYPVLREDSGATQRACNLMVMPTAYLVDPQGRLLFEYSGFTKHHGEVLEEHLTRRLEKIDTSINQGE